jgi:hypothetical protein
MLRIVLPTVARISAATATGRQGRRGVTPAKSAAAIATARNRIAGAIADVGAVTPSDARVTVEIIIAVDCDVVVASPTASPTPAAAPEGPHHDTYPERDGNARGVISRRRVINRWIGVNG